MPTNRDLSKFTAEEVAEVESPELTNEELASLRPDSEALPPKLFAALTARRPGQRGPQKAPTKKVVTLRVDPDIVEGYRATGDGWQRRMQAALKAGLGMIKGGGLSIAAKALATKKAKARSASVRKAPSKKRA
jgi:uncharacterized protein (DUF4415 family)